MGIGELPAPYTAAQRLTFLVSEKQDNMKFQILGAREICVQANLTPEIESRIRTAANILRIEILELSQRASGIYVLLGGPT